MPKKRMPKFVDLTAVVIPDPRWRPEHARKGAPRSPHPCIVVVAYLDERGDPWIYDEAVGLRRITRGESDRLAVRQK